jgi:hypothetical protein
MCSNTSDSNATKKLLQLRQLGVNTIADPLERRVRINGETPGRHVLLDRMGVTLRLHV